MALIVSTPLRASLGSITPLVSSRSFTSLVSSAQRGPSSRHIRCTKQRQRNAQQRVTIRISVRYYSSSSDCSKSTLPPDQQASYDRLRPIVDNFEAPIDWAVAYGSGVMKQAQVKPGDPPSLTDLLLSTPSPIEFHSTNLRQNPSHYPLHARIMGAKGIAHVQEQWGAGIWYVTDVNINGISVKYGIISTSSLITDLTQWKTFYLSGRLHKPTLSLISPSGQSQGSSLTEALEINLKNALSLALLSLPERFTEDALWETIAGLSYSGDPRMNIPGGENPQKIKNIVRGPGAREGFRGMYGPYLAEMGVRWVDGEKDGYVSGQWRGDSEGVLCKPTSPEYQVELFDSLPTSLRESVLNHYDTSEAGMTNEQDRSMRAVRDPKFNSIVSTELRNIIHRPALRQSIKGLFTAGFTKSYWYALAKFRKWLKGRGGGK
ncbi:hypothetical protein I302_100363 [Kwoniella bestiolae CBS 10118]|uniref:Phosphatidate cytidylyltransferase, mitochondrial n=1 Tax=Kwoniella bestiolae CBS 10118 TaxID=1296100 RepID=A0A1B9G4Y6_9TREE|nr:hypothetical protein I302_03737 [Kwoniella bestiolae CBS 10118]OCF26060.1 hypothetical protein I302_03737 [Kwoniella bestiolae CBS 10118]